MVKPNRVEFTEYRQVSPEITELYLIRAEKTPDNQWEFYERDTWEVRWYKSSLSDISRLQRALLREIQEQRIQQVREVRDEFRRNQRGESRPLNPTTIISSQYHQEPSP